jgi:RNA polymerase sigma factor (sigma-70 family)
MNNLTPFSEQLQEAFEPRRDIVRLVDDILGLCREHGLQFDWQADRCRVRPLGTQPQELTEIPLPKSVFRAILARLAAQCNERIPNSVSPYGGEGELSVSTNPPTVFRVAFTNTPGEQRLEVRRMADSKNEATYKDVYYIKNDKSAEREDKEDSERTARSPSNLPKSANLSPEARITLVDHLERVLCDPDALRSHLLALRRNPMEIDDRDWDEEVIAQVLDDTRRLELLEDEELQSLNRDQAVLVALSQEIRLDWWPAWNRPLAAAGREWALRTGFSRPDWDEIVGSTSVEKPANGLEVAAEEETANELELAASFGQVLEKPTDAGGRALVFDWEWNRTLEEIEGLEGHAVASPKRVESRREVRFRLKAYDARGKKSHSWELTISGEPPEDAKAEVRVDLDAWGERNSDTTSPVPIGSGLVAVELHHFPDTSRVFSNFENGGQATVTVFVCGEYDWRVAEVVPGPILGKDFYELWYSTEAGQDCYASTLARLRAVVGESRQGVRDEHRVADALRAGAEEVIRRRYVPKYWSIKSYADFSRCVHRAAVNSYRTGMRKTEPITGWEAFNPSSIVAGQETPERAEIKAYLFEALQKLDEKSRKILEWRFWSRFTYLEIGEILGIEQSAARVRCFRALKVIGNYLKDKGFGVEDIGPSV